MQALRTPDDRFTGLPGFDFAAHYAEVPDGEGGTHSPACGGLRGTQEGDRRQHPAEQDEGADHDDHDGERSDPGEGVVRPAPDGSEGAGATNNVFQWFENGTSTIDLSPFDNVVDAALKTDMKLIVTLTNNWADYGGMVPGDRLARRG